MASKDLIDLRSDEGQKLLEDVKTGCDGACQQTLLALFAKQATNFTCGIASCAMILCANAVNKQKLDVDTEKSKLPYTEGIMFSLPQTLATINFDQLRSDGGLTLDMLGELFVSHGCRIKLRHASDSTADEFRADAISAVKHADSKVGVVINYKQDVLGQGVPYGHISPLAGYHASTDRLLILDTWPETEECWAKVDDIFISMNTTDHVCGKTRGYIVVNF